MPYDKKSNEISKEPGAPACNGCAVWLMFGKNCWYFWERKKHCTMWTPSSIPPVDNVN